MSVISFEIFFAHFLGIENMHGRIGRGNIVFKRRDQIGVKLISYALALDKSHAGAVHSEHIQHFIVILPFLGGLFIKAVIHKFRELSLFEHSEQNFSDKPRFEFRGETVLLIKVGAAEYSVIDMNITALHQQPHEATSH